jgi:hypothetical protein
MLYVYAFLFVKHKPPGIDTRQTAKSLPAFTETWGSTRMKFKLVFTKSFEKILKSSPEYQASYLHGKGAFYEAPLYKK